MTDWTSYFMGFARHAASKSKDTTKVGCVIVGPDKAVRMTGFNGPPRGVIETEDRRQRPLKYHVTAHAESNAIAFSARTGVKTESCDIYVTHFPCLSCAKSIIQAGIKCVVVDDGEVIGTHWGDEQKLAQVLFNEAGVDVRFI